MAESFSKKEKIKKKIEKQKQKALRREERKESNDKGKDLKEMMMYVDSFGRLTETPPTKIENDEDFDIESIQLGAAPIEAEEAVKKGTITFLSEKGYGFITSNSLKDNIFFHTNNCVVDVKNGNKVSFEVEKSIKGLVAVNINIIK